MKTGTTTTPPAATPPLPGLDGKLALSAKDKLDACLKQAELGAALWKKRQNYEWKVTLLLWGGLLASAKFVQEAHVPVRLGFLVIGGIAFLVFYAVVWLRGLWRANHNDKQWEIFFRCEAAKLLSNDSSTVGSPPRKVSPGFLLFLADYSALFQILVTGLVVTAAITVMASKTIGTARMDGNASEAATGTPPPSTTNRTSAAGHGVILRSQKGKGVSQP